jgi:hypothetical protein
MSLNWSFLGNGSEESRECYCGMITYLRTSRTEKNPGIQFFGCTQYGKGPHCKYFEWFEPHICECGSKLVYEMRMRIKTLEEELRKHAKKEKRSNIRLFVCHGDYLLHFCFLCICFRSRLFI